MKPRHVISFALTYLAFPLVTSAHAFGQQYTLPLPVNFYITGGIAAFVASCTVLLLFSEPTPASTPLRTLPRGILIPKVLRWFLAAFGLFVLVFSLALAYLGQQSFASNPLPDLFWIIFLLLFTYCTAILAGTWQYLDPFRTIAKLVSSDIEERKAPVWLPYVPILSLLVLLWLELYSSGLGALPIVVGTALVAIGAVSNIGSSIFGLKTWFENGDLFTTFFGVVGRVAPFQIIQERLTFMWPGERLVRESAEHISILLFTLVMLGSTVLDGIRETKIWYQLLAPVPYSWDNYIGIALLVVVPVLLFGLYSLAILAIKKLTRVSISFADLRLKFAFSLVPIAVAYHFAHYFSLILSQGQSFIASISDPFELGWNIFGTVDYQMNIGLVGADQVWYIQLSVIVLGHILAAIVAHFTAQRTFTTRRAVILSQLPMLVLMVGLTAFGLWTLGQPFATQ